MAELSFEPGDVIFHAGDEGRCAYTIVSGRVEILDPGTSPSGGTATLEPGQIFGETGLVDERPRAYTARAMEPVRVLVVSQAELVDLLMRQRGPAEPAPSLALSALILAGSARAARVLPAAGLRVERLPFLVGRAWGKGERAPLEVNDLSLPDAQPYNVSRNHFSLERLPDRLIVRDRGSFLGTIVNDEAIGGRQPNATADLVPGENVVVVGSSRSPFTLRIVVRGPDPA